MTSTPVSSMLLVVLASLVGSFGAVFLKLGAVLLTNVWSLLNWRLGLGAGLYVGSSVLYAWGIKNGEISVLFPMVSLGYVWTMVWARLFFDARFTKQKVMGLGIILLGVLCVGPGQQLEPRRRPTSGQDFEGALVDGKHRLNVLPQRQVNKRGIGELCLQSSVFTQDCRNCRSVRLCQFKNPVEANGWSSKQFLDCISVESQ